MDKEAKSSAVAPDFAQKLKKARRQKGLSQGQLALKTGSDIQRISKYERGILIPTTEILVRIAESLDVTVDYLVRSGEAKAVGKIKDVALLDLFAQVDELSEADKQPIKALLEAFIKKSRFEELART